MATEQDNDLEIISRIRLGEKQAFGDLVRKYQLKVRGYCSYMLCDVSLAEDAAQEIFIKAFGGLDHFRADSSFSTWLYRITVNHCNDILRSAKYRRTESLDSLPARKYDSIMLKSSQTTSLEEKIEQRNLIQVTLSDLKPEYREILILREIEDLTYEQLSEVLSCSRDSVKARLRRARTALARKLHESSLREP